MNKTRVHSCTHTLFRLSKNKTKLLKKYNIYYFQLAIILTYCLTGCMYKIYIQITFM